MIIKKLLFAPLFLLSLSYFFLKLPKFLSPDILFSFEVNLLIELLMFMATLLISGLFFVIFITFSSDWRISLPVGLIASTLPLLLTPIPSSFLLSGGILTATALTLLVLNNKLTNYLTFQPTTLLLPSIKQFAMVTILFTSLAFYISASNQVKSKGFTIPDQFIDSVLQLIPPQPQQETVQPIPTLDKTQIEQLKQNPALLDQFGIDPSLLDTLSNPQTQKKQTTSQDVIKVLVKKQLEDTLKPHLSYIPIISTLLFYITLTSISSLLSILLNPILFLAFYIFEKTGFTKFVTETREVKKLVV